VFRAFGAHCQFETLYIRRLRPKLLPIR
jgi:hypothetical protein